MSRDVYKLYSMQTAKLVSPPCAPLVNIPIGKPWKMLAIDILEVLISHRNNRYLLVIMDYFTKWAEAVPLPDQKATSITKTIINLCSSFGIFNLTKAGILKIAYFGKCSHALLHTTHKGWHGRVFQSVTFIVTSLLYSA